MLEDSRTYTLSGSEYPIEQLIDNLNTAEWEVKEPKAQQEVREIEQDGHLVGIILDSTITSYDTALAQHLAELCNSALTKHLAESEQIFNIPKFDNYMKLFLKTLRRAGWETSVFEGPSKHHVLRYDQQVGFIDNLKVSSKDRLFTAYLAQLDFGTEPVKQSSPNWWLISEIDPGLTLHQRAVKALGNLQAAFPYDEGFPVTPYHIETARFSLIVPIESWRDVEEVEAIVDYSTQYRAEGKQWNLLKGSSENRGIAGDHVVIAWYEK